MTEATCEHCGRPVIAGAMRKSGRPVFLDPEPHALGNLQLVELGTVVQFIPNEWRDPTSRWFVRPGERYRSHMVTCPQNQRTCSEAVLTFISDVDAALGLPERTGVESGRASASQPPVAAGKAPGSAAPVDISST